MKSKIKQLVYFALCTSASIMLCLWPGFQANAQKGARLTPQLDALAAGGSTTEWIDFRHDTKVNAATFFTDLKAGFGLSENDQMNLLKTDKDQIGYSHYRYQQYYKNHKVLYGEYIVHQQADGFVKSANGRLITGLNLGGEPAINQEQALANALKFMNAGKYLWQNPAMESELKRQEKNENATYYPKGELVYAPGDIDGSYKASEYKLAWHFKVYTDDPAVTAKSVCVDAFTGKVIHHNDIAMNCSGGSGASGFNGNVNISTQLSGGSYRSLNDCQATNIYVYNCNRGSAANTFYTDGDNAWTDASAVQAQWGAAQVYSYYNTQHSRQSWNGTNGDMVTYNNAVYGSPTPTANNACWGCFGNNTIFGAGNTTAATDDWNTDDIMGHEFTHGVTQASAGLAYSKESGGLNESYSDIFGEMVESWAEGNCDYLVGGDRGAIRSFITPKTYGQPDTYLGTNWFSTTGCTPTGNNDNCGVHTNSGVQNRWFYLLSEGGSGTNDFGTTYSVTGITRFKARLIAYRALTLYETSTTAYIDARAATLHAALDLYGVCSQEIQAVGDAWHAVGVESQSAQYVNDVCGAVASGDFKQAISVLAGNACGLGNTINTGTAMTYYAARDHVVLYAGFSAPVGSRFTAYLEPCSSTMFKSNGTDNVTMSDAERGIKTPVVAVQKTVPATDVADRSGISMSPNPFVSSFDLTINSNLEKKAQVSVYNTLGIKVKGMEKISLNKGSNKISVDGSSFARGVYMVEVTMGELKTIKKIVKL